MAPSRHDWKIVYWDFKLQHNQPTNMQRKFNVTPYGEKCYWLAYGIKLKISRVTFLKSFLPLKNFGMDFRFSSNREDLPRADWDETEINVKLSVWSWSNAAADYGL